MVASVDVKLHFLLKILELIIFGCKIEKNLYIILGCVLYLAKRLIIEFLFLKFVKSRFERLFNRIEWIDWVFILIIIFLLYQNQKGLRNIYTHSIYTFLIRLNCCC